MGKLIKYSSPILIAISMALTFWAIFTTPEDVTVENGTAISGNLWWAYGLFGVAVLVAILTSVSDMFNAPSGVKRSIFSLVAIVGLIVISYVVANGHTYQIVDLNTQGFFGRPETVITDASILVTYVVFAAAIIAAIYSAVTDAFK